MPPRRDLGPLRLAAPHDQRSAFTRWRLRQHGSGRELHACGFELPEHQLRRRHRMHVVLFWGRPAPSEQRLLPGGGGALPLDAHELDVPRLPDARGLAL